MSPSATYTFDRRLSWVKRVMECTLRFMDDYGAVPNIARVSTFCTGYPEQVGVVKLVRGRGLFEFELELGIEPPTTQGAQQPMLSAPQDTTEQS